MTKKPTIWSGKNPLPEKDAIVGVRFLKHTVAAQMVETFVDDGEEAAYIGVKLHLLELPEQAESFGWCHPLERLCLEKGRSGLLEFFQKEEAFCAGIFGAEIAEPTPEPPTWFQKEGLGAEEEFAALVPKVLGGRDWKEELSITAWCQGQWHSTPYAKLCGELQRIRNSGHMDFIDYAVKKNRGLIDACKRWLRPQLRVARQAY